VTAASQAKPQVLMMLLAFRRDGCNSGNPKGWQLWRNDSDSGISSKNSGVDDVAGTQNIIRE